MVTMDRYELKKQSYRIHASVILLAGGLLLSRLYFGSWANPHTAFFVWIPSSLGALGLGSWTLRMTHFCGKDIDTIPGAIIGFGILVATAIVIAGAL
jgi:hypothetical protein